MIIYSKVDRMSKKTPITEVHKQESKRLKLIWQNKKGDLTQEKASEMLGFSTGAVTQYLNGHTKLNLKTLLKFSNLLGFDPSHVSKRLCEEIDIDNNPSNISNINTVKVPMLSTTASMGAGVSDLITEQDQIVRNIETTKKWLNLVLPAFTNIENLRIITGLGVSMKPLYNDGDLLWCDIGINDIDQDAIYVLRVNGELFIKHVQRKPFNNTFELISENKNYEKITINDSDEFQVLGKILGALNFNRF